LADEGELNEGGTALLKGCVHHVLAVDPQHVERDERDRDGRIAIQHARAYVREVGIAVSPRHEFAVEHQPGRKSRQLGQQLGDPPAAAASRSQAVFRRDERTEAIPLTSKDHPRPEGSGPRRER